MTPADNITPVEQRPSGSGWSEQTVEPKSMTFGSIPPTGDRGTCGSRERTRTDARTKTTANQRGAVRRGGRDRAGRPLAGGNAVADTPRSLAGRPRRPCPVGWGRAGNGRTRHGPGDGRARRKRRGGAPGPPAPARYPIPLRGGSGVGGPPASAAVRPQASPGWGPRTPPVAREIPRQDDDRPPGRAYDPRR